MRMSNQNLRLPAEWETDCAILMAWPHEDTDWSYMLDDAQNCCADIAQNIAKRHPVIIVAPDCGKAKEKLSDAQNIFFIEAETNDTWTRDYGPITVETAGGYLPLDFCFNGWGMKFAACHDNLVTEKLFGKKLLGIRPCNHRDFVLEGGGIESDGNGCLMTTSLCQLSPNRNAALDKERIEQRLLEFFGAEKVLWVNHGYLAGDDTDSHIDTLARFAVNDTIVYVGCDDPADEHFEELAAMEREIKEFTTVDGRKFNLVRLPMPDAIYDENGERLPATYANFLATPDTIYMPAYGQTRKDELAARILNVAFEREVVAIDCRALIRQHGSLHCATMQMPLQILNT